MPSHILTLTKEIVVAHAPSTQLTTEQLVDEIKEVYNALSSLESGAMPVSGKTEAGSVTELSVPLKDIVKAKYVLCLVCGKKMKTLKAHLRKAHNLTPKEYYKRFDLDPKKFPLVCKDYSAARSQLAKERGLGAQGRKKKPGV